MTFQSWFRRARPALLAAVVLAGCSSDQLSVVVLSARAPGDKCAFDDDTLYVSRGSVDFRPFDASGDFTDRYYQVFSWQNNLTPIPLVVNGQTIDPGTGNNFIADSVVYEYQYSDPNVTFETETANFHAIITAGGTATNNSVPTDLIQPKAAAKLATVVNTTPQTLLVTFQIFGNAAAGNSLSTNKTTFPLTVYVSNPAPLVCLPGEVVATVCGSPGRDQDVHCVAAGL